jgi:hypothetical protein
MCINGIILDVVHDEKKSPAVTPGRSKEDCNEKALLPSPMTLPSLTAPQV